MCKNEPVWFFNPEEPDSQLDGLIHRISFVKKSLSPGPNDKRTGSPASWVCEPTEYDVASGEKKTLWGTVDRSSVR